MSTHGLEQTAFHEAGHVVAYLEHGLNFRYVTVRAKAPVFGRVVLHKPRSMDPLNLAVITCAGPISEGIFLWNRDRSDYEVEGYDRSIVIDETWIGQDDNEQLYLKGLDREKAEPIALQLVERNWSQITTIADALVKSPRALTYRECEDIYFRSVAA